MQASLSYAEMAKAHHKEQDESDSSDSSEETSDEVEAPFALYGIKAVDSSGDDETDSDDTDSSDITDLDRRFVYYPPLYPYPGYGGYIVDTDESESSGYESDSDDDSSDDDSSEEEPVVPYFYPTHPCFPPYPYHPHAQVPRQQHFGSFWPYAQSHWPHAHQNFSAFPHSNYYPVPPLAYAPYCHPQQYPQHPNPVYQHYGLTPFHALQLDPNELWAEYLYLKRKAEKRRKEKKQQKKQEKDLERYYSGYYYPYYQNQYFQYPYTPATDFVEYPYYWSVPADARARHHHHHHPHYHPHQSQQAVQPAAPPAAKVEAIEETVSTDDQERKEEDTPSKTSHSESACTPSELS